MHASKIIDHIVNWLTQYAKKSGAKGFVLGVSGGIDSAVVSTLAAKTGLKTLVLEMPIRQKEDQVSRAQNHISFLKENFSNVDGFCVDLTPAFETFESGVALKNKDNDKNNLALANTRSRMRMLTLYYYGQINGLLVTGTGNKVEDFGVGFFTKYGDGGVDISPIADLLKSEVYQLARELGVIEEIQKAAPTDGLWDAAVSTDEDQMGATYPELEWAMSVYDEHNSSDFEGRQKEVFEIFDRLHKATLHKILPIPVCSIPKEYKS